MTVRRACLAIAITIVIAACLATIAFSFGTMQRPWNNVEGSVFFEASRIRDHLPLYIDPIRGAFDYGPVPARYYVLYPPILPWILSYLPAANAPSILRLVDTCGWFALLGWIALGARDGARHAAWIAAAFVGGIYSLALFTASSRPDGIAILLAGLAIERSARKGKIDPLAAILFALAPWIKPNVLGLACGAFFADLAFVRARSSIVALFTAIATTLVVVVPLHLASHGVWIAHLLRSTGQEPSMTQWLEQVPSRMQFLGLPLAFAAWLGWTMRRDRGVRIALAALVTSFAWALVCAAKIGSAGNYWIEPCLAALVIVTRVPFPRFTPRVSLALAIAFVVQAAWTGVASIRSAYEWFAYELHDERTTVDHARRVCNAASGDVMLAEESGVEMELNGRITTTPYQITHLARRGLFPIGVWVADVSRPEVAGVVMQSDLLERPLGEINVNHDSFAPEIRSALVARFTLREANGAWRIYCAR